MSLHRQDHVSQGSIVKVQKFTMRLVCWTFVYFVASAYWAVRLAITDHLCLAEMLEQSVVGFCFRYIGFLLVGFTLFFGFIG